MSEKPPLTHPYRSDLLTHIRCSLYDEGNEILSEKPPLIQARLFSLHANQVFALLPKKMSEKPPLTHPNRSDFLTHIRCSLYDEVVTY